MPRTKRALVHLFCSIACIALLPSAQAQVNTEALISSGTERHWSGSLDAGADVNRGNTDSTRGTVSAGLRYLTLHEDVEQPEGGEPWFFDRFIVSGRYAIQVANDERIANGAFIHSRWTRMWHPNAGHEIYGQLEFDEFRNLALRALIGAGGRFVFFNNELVQMWAGTGYMAEFERFSLSEEDELVFEPTQMNHRWASYLALKLNDAENRVRWVNTLYFQPRFDDFSDIQALYDSTLKVTVLGPLTLSSSLNLQFDSDPPPGIEKLDVRVLTSLGVTF